MKNYFKADLMPGIVLGALIVFSVGLGTYKTVEMSGAPQPLPSFPLKCVSLHRGQGQQYIETLLDLGVDCVRTGHLMYYDWSKNGEEWSVLSDVFDDLTALDQAGIDIILVLSTIQPGVCAPLPREFFDHYAAFVEGLLTRLELLGIQLDWLTVGNEVNLVGGAWTDFGCHGDADLIAELLDHVDHLFAPLMFDVALFDGPEYDFIADVLALTSAPDAVGIHRYCWYPTLAHECNNRVSKAVADVRNITSLPILLTETNILEGSATEPPLFGNCDAPGLEQFKANFYTQVFTRLDGNTLQAVVIYALDTCNDSWRASGFLEFLLAYQAIRDVPKEPYRVYLPILER
jgi:hypothetical protein